MLASDILTPARQGLSDTNKERWTDARLLTLLNDGLNILMMDTILLLDKLYVELVEDLVEYDMSNVAVKILRVEYKGLPLKMTSHENMDKLTPNWKQRTGLNLTHVLTDKARPGRFQLYPKLTELTASLVEQDGVYGGITDISYTDYELTMTDDFGEIGTPDAAGWIYVHFCKKINKISALDTEIDIDDFCATALSHYIIARALRDNQDTQNRGLAAEEMNIFDAVVEKFAIAKSKLYSNGALESTYRGGIQ